MISICYLTCRREPKWEWFVDSLARQNPAAIELLFVDFHAWREGVSGHGSIAPQQHLDEERVASLRRVIDGRFAWSIIPPKPCVWQGPFRLTKGHWFAAANARNTAFVAARGEYVVCVDDLSVLQPGWWDQVKTAAKYGFVVGGAYRKVLNLQVENGEVRGYEPMPKGDGMDSRIAARGKHGFVQMGGGELFGCSFGIPLETALAVNGFDELCDGQGFEDCDFGIRVERAGGQIFYNHQMMTYESEELHHEPCVAGHREVKRVTPGRLPPGYSKNTMSDHVMINRLLDDPARTWTLGSHYTLRVLRDEYQRTGLLPIPDQPNYDWRDGTLLKDI